MTGGLLRIDVDAEIRKLTGRRFKTPAGYAIELLTWAAARKPQRIDVTVSRSRFALRLDGEGPSAAAMRSLAVLFDPDKPSDERHDALVAIEGGEPRLLAAFSPAGARVRIAAANGGRAVALECSRRGVRRVPSGDDERPGIEVRGRGRDPALERKLLEEAARYAIAPIYVDGERVNRGLVLDDVIVQIDLRNERLRGVVGLPLKSDLVRIQRLEHEIRAEERIQPAVGGMIFHAAVDERDPDFDATMGTLRRAGRRLYARLAEMFEELGADRRGRAFELLLERYEHTHEAKLLEGVRAFAAAKGPPFDLWGVRELAARGALCAISIDEPLGRYDLDGRAVLRLTQKQHRFLEKELSARIEPPPLRRDDRGLKARAASWWKGIAARFVTPLGGRPGRPLDDAELMPEERAFLDAVRAEIRSGAFALPNEARPFGLRFRMADGQRRPFVRVAVRGGPSEYDVARDHPLVRSMIAAFTADRGFLYAALSALARGHDGYAENRTEARRQAT
jgi:hypothetical protein